MAFDPQPHLMKIKGSQLYLPVKYRLMWLRDEASDADISTEMVHLDLDAQVAVFRAQVSIPERGSATGYGSETARDFADYLEKAETKAIGRALAALGFGTQFATEIDEGERVVDSPVPAARSNGHGNGRAKLDEKALEALRVEVAEALKKDEVAAAKLPKGADDMSREELDKTLAWLRSRRVRAS